MLKKIPVADVRLGMHLHALEGAWLDHPFWKTSFVIREPAQLQQLQGSKAQECWIDEAKGLAHQAPAAPVAAGMFASAAPAPAARTTAEPTPPVRVELQAELARAAAICEQARSSVQAVFYEARLGRAVDSGACLPVVQAITESVQRNPGALISLARLKLKDDYTYLHSVTVCALMVALAQQMGHHPEQVQDAGFAGLLHDVGKALVPEAVLNKPGKLTAEEFSVIRSHTERGHALLKSSPGASEAMLDVCLNHHERLDGKGYPRALQAERISLLARMGAVCDVYDAITSNRPYKSGWDPADALARMASWQGHFDGAVFNAFVRSLGIYPSGSLVRLESGKLAVVTEQNEGKLVAPVVKAFYSTKSKMPISPLVMDLGRPGCSDRIVARESPEHWGFAFLDDLWLPQEAVRKVKRGNSR
jgi:putative nucleotidyltransferase with HDIG domain